MLRFLLFSILWISSPALAQEAAITGRAEITDGDTIRIGKIPIRFHGVDAPESGQVCLEKDKPWLCGSKAAFALADFINGDIVTCKPVTIDRYKRIVAKCWVRGEDIQAFMAREGHAVAFVKYSHDYVQYEAQAKAAQKGMWRGEFVMPWDFRACMKEGGKKPLECSRATGAAFVQAGASCEGQIKGNVNAKGDKIYHTTESPHYSRTRMDKGGGERWFCNEAEAQAAGWLKAGKH